MKVTVGLAETFILVKFTLKAFIRKSDAAIRQGYHYLILSSLKFLKNDL